MNHTAQVWQLKKKAQNGRGWKKEVRIYSLLCPVFWNIWHRNASRISEQIGTLHVYLLWHFSYCSHNRRSFTLKVWERLHSEIILVLEFEYLHAKICWSLSSLSHCYLPKQMNVWKLSPFLLPWVHCNVIATVYQNTPYLDSHHLTQPQSFTVRWITPSLTTSCCQSLQLYDFGVIFFFFFFEWSFF